MPPRLQTYQAGDRRIAYLVLFGVLDESELQGLVESVTDLLRSSPHTVVLDVTHVDSIDESGVDLLTSLRDVVEQLGAKFHLLAALPPVDLKLRELVDASRQRSFEPS